MRFFKKATVGFTMEFQEMKRWCIQGRDFLSGGRPDGLEADRLLLTFPLDLSVSFMG
jgi:hypothetical protein